MDELPALADSEVRLQLHSDDEDAVRRMAEDGDVLAVHPNTSRWWNHASFALPLLGFIVSTGVGLIFGIYEALGFGLFLGVITLLMLPVVQFTWRATATCIVLTDSGATALHAGKVLARVGWDEVDRIERIETMGNIRWKVQPVEGPHVTIDGEILDVPGLLDRASELAGVALTT